MVATVDDGAVGLVEVGAGAVSTVVVDGGGVACGAARRPVSPHAAAITRSPTATAPADFQRMGDLGEQRGMIRRDSKSHSGRPGFAIGKFCLALTFCQYSDTDAAT